MIKRTQQGKICGYRYAELEYREFGKQEGANLFHNAEYFKCTKLGHVAVRMRTDNLMLVAWKDDVYGHVFWWEGHGEELRGLRLKRHAYEYSDYGCAFYSVEPHSLWQFCHHILSFGIKFEADMDRPGRIEFAKRVCEAFGETFKSA